jgi:hypothetical protein
MDLNIISGHMVKGGRLTLSASLYTSLDGITFFIPAPSHYLQAEFEVSIVPK